MAALVPHVNHLTDDSLLFFKASVRGAEEVLNLLNMYCKVLGQKINSTKFSIFFNKGCMRPSRDEVKNVFSV